MKYCEANEETIKQHRTTAPFPLKKKRRGEDGGRKKFFRNKKKKKKKKKFASYS